MNFKTSAIFLILPLFSFAQEMTFPNYPVTTLLHSTNDEIHGLNVECEQISSGSNFKIGCKFAQTMISAKQNKDSIDNEINEMANSAEVTFIEFANGVCSQTKSAQKNDLSNDELKVLQKSKELCNVSTEEDAKEKAVSLLRYIKTEESKICVVKTGYQWQESFTYKSTNDGLGYWVSEPTPSGTCGIMNISTLKQNPGYDFLWLYESQRIITNKEAKYSDSVSCSMFDERKVTFSWKSKSHILKCEKIEFGL